MRLSDLLITIATAKSMTTEEKSDAAMRLMETFEKEMCEHIGGKLNDRLGVSKETEDYVKELIYVYLGAYL